jgi:hypothetical protein
MTPISAAPGTEAQATFERDFEELDDEDELADDPLESEDEPDEPFDEPDEDDDESPDDEDAPAFSVFLSPEPDPEPEPAPESEPLPDLVSDDGVDELESAPFSAFSLVPLPRESVR